jgi:hypothetical protein
MATTSFAALKKNRSKSLDKLTDQLQKISSKGYTNPDEGKYWKPTRDTAGNGFAIIRFLPEPDGEDFAFVRMWDHAFQGTGGWYIENSRTTLGSNEPDPVSELNTKLWNSTKDEDSAERKQARTQKRRLHFISNIYVIKDSGNPENEGKVFMFKYGKKIYDMLNELMNPSFEDEERVNPFDLWEGANFRLKIRKGDGGYPNYDKSEFDSPSPLFEDDDQMEAIWKQSHSLKDITAPHNFKSYDELQAKLHKVLGLSGSSGRSQNASQSAEDEIDDEIDMSALGSRSQPKAASAPKMKESTPAAQPAGDDDGDEDDLNYFKSLASRT